MPQLSDPLFQFQSEAVSKDTFCVVRFHGEEGLSQLYSFEVLLISQKADLDLEAILQSPATFTIKSKNGDLPFHGILASFEQLHQAGGWVFYRATLRPKLWWLTLTHHNQIFLGQKIDQFLGAVLQDGGLSQGLDFEFKLTADYPTWDYICQYGESHFGFVSRWMERDGVYYWFEQGAQGEKMVASDTLISHVVMPENESFHYAPPTGMDAEHADEIIKAFTLKRTPMPKNLMVKDYNYEKPSLDLTARAMVADKGRGDIYLYGEHFKDIPEGNRLAQVRAEGWGCREQAFHGLSNIPAVRPGYVFDLDRHYRSDFNQRYLTCSVNHEGNQERYLVSGLGVKGLPAKDELFYRNSFNCIPATTQFRPARVTERPRIYGTISAKIDAAGSGQYAELDEHGRYKVIMPFDISGRSDGKASAYIRMMQPYAGDGMGIHAPLHKGTEVLLSFIDGDPDRPIIAGAVPNSDTASPVTDAEQTMVKMVTGGGNKFQMDDLEGKEHLMLHSPYGDSVVRIGSPDKGLVDDVFYDATGVVDQLDRLPGGGEVANAIDQTLEVSIQMFSSKGMEIKAAAESKTIEGSSTEIMLGMCSRYVAGTDSSVNLGSVSKTITGTDTKAHAIRVRAGEGRVEAYVRENLAIVGSTRTIAARELSVEESLEHYGSRTQLYGSKQEVCENSTRFFSTRESVVDSDTMFQQEANTVVGENVEMLQNSTRLTGTETHFSESETKVGTTRTELREEVTQVSNQSIAVAETSIISSELILLM